MWLIFDNVVYNVVNNIIDNRGLVMGVDEKKIITILRNGEGLSITDIVNKSKLSRSTVRTILAKLEGANKIRIRKVGMAKLYVWENDKIR